jgi:hypothetical protein
MPNVSNASSMRRRAAGVCLIAAPLTGLASAVVSPHLEGDAEKDLATIMFRQDAFLIGGLLGVLALVFLLGAVLGLRVVLLLGRDKVVSASGFVLLAIGLGWIGRSVLAQSDAEWEGRVAASAPGAPESG